MEDIAMTMTMLNYIMIATALVFLGTAFLLSGRILAGNNNLPLGTWCFWLLLVAVVGYTAVYFPVRFIGWQRTPAFIVFKFLDVVVCAVFLGGIVGGTKNWLVQNRYKLWHKPRAKEDENYTRT